MNTTITFPQVTPQPQGWLCPKCGSAHGPHVNTCPGTTLQPAVSPSLPSVPVSYANLDPRHIARPVTPGPGAPGWLKC